MSLDIKVPAVGESITEVTIYKWLKQDGEYVEMDDPLAELESDKATFELNAEAAGKLIHKASEGDTLSVGDIICSIDESASNGKSDNSGKKDEAKKDEKPGKSKDSSGPSKTGKVIEMKVPSVGESISEVTIATWMKKSGDLVVLDEVIAEIESDKATFELTAEGQGLLEIVAEAGTTLGIGDLICRIEEMEGEMERSEDVPHAPEETGSSTTRHNISSYATGHASPAAAKILAEKGIEAKQVKGTGVDGRITKEDALKAVKNEARPASGEADKKQETAPVPKGDRDEKREKMTQLRKTISRRLVSVKNETAMLTTFNEVDMKPIMEIRSRYKETFKEKYEINLGFMSFFVKAVCVALQDWPAVNAKIDGEEIVYHHYCDISIAVSTPRGLVVPVIRNAEQMSFDQIEKEIIRLATRARDNKLSIDEMQGGTFTITNGGVFGSMMSTPIINAPQSGILGMHNIVERPVAINGEVVIRPMMYVALSYDHRTIDGRESVSFLVRVKQILEDPTRLLLGV
ncbi:MAG: 2-oxoglutarate dehydrogenase complex dihydrolipoyllysine-residue succinyltransferase [Cyclobacteriaceae bacterium]|nr:2-oxoglutarate dehydrogenase complex dihydrolipoyllysine-residue succinyltransferase [Cyclobacteriaceae bacterium]